MSVTDPIADFLTIIRNGYLANHAELTAPSSKMKLSIAKILKDEGYIHNYKFFEENKRNYIQISLKYEDNGKPVIRKIFRVSKPGRRVYCKAADIPEVLNGLGICIVSTSTGIMSDMEAKKRGVGGEILCKVW